MFCCVKIVDLDLSEGARLVLRTTYGHLIKEWKTFSTDNQYIVTPGHQAVLEFFTGASSETTFTLDYFRGKKNG